MHKNKRTHDVIYRQHCPVNIAIQRRSICTLLTLPPSSWSAPPSYHSHTSTFAHFTPHLLYIHMRNMTSNILNQLALMNACQYPVSLITSAYIYTSVPLESVLVSHVYMHLIITSYMMRKIKGMCSY